MQHMTDDKVWTKIVEVIRETFDDEALEIERETTAADVEDWDSLSNIELMVALEAAFDVSFKTGEIAGLANVGELADIISRRVERDD